MEYLKVRWIHQHATEPVFLLSELDDQRYEVRKIEIFANGRMGFASENESSGETVLGEKPIPPAANIRMDPQFVVQQINRREFDEIWTVAVAGGNWKSSDPTTN